MRTTNTLRTALAVVVIATGSAFWIRAQITADQQLKKISGIAVDAVTGARVRQSRMSLRPIGGGEPLTVATDEQGRFDFERVKPGQYTLHAVKDAYERVPYGARSVLSGGQILTVDTLHDVTGLEYRMMPRGSIAGKVMNRSGEPVRGVNIVFGLASRYGAPALMEVSPILSDDLGHFRIHSLPSGTYYIEAIPTTQRSPREALEIVPLPAYYPSAPDLASAQAVLLQPGQDLGGIDIVLREGAGFQVEGKVVGVHEGIALSDIDLVLVPLERSAFRGKAYARLLSKRIGGLVGVRPDGTFRLSGVEAGAYELIALPAGDRADARLGHVDVTVGRQNLKDVQLPLDKAVTISWTARVEGEEWSGNLCWFMINPTDADAMLGSRQMVTDASGGIAMAGVLPGQYVITTDCRKALYVKSAVYRNGSAVRDVLDAGLHLTSGDEGGVVEVVLARSVSLITGVVKDDDEPSPGRCVTLIPDPPLPGRTLHFRSAITDDAGRFQIARVAPGEYQLYSWVEELPSTVLVDPILLSRFRNYSKKVVVQAGTQDVGIVKTVVP